MNGQYKIIALDIDGTLLTSQNKVSPQTKQALEHSRSSGIDIILVTGRHHMMTTSLHTFLELKTPIICANGAYIYDPENQKITEGTEISRNQRINLFPLIKKYSFDVIFYFTDSIGYQPDNRLIQKAKAYFDENTKEPAPNFLMFETLHQLFELDKALWKIDLIHPDATAIDAFISETTPEYNLELQRTSFNGLEIIHHKNNKGSRLHSWVYKQGIDMSQVIAFGDNQNDISMLTKVGLGVAMGNASDMVKRCAQRLTKSNDDDGIAAVLAEILCGEASENYGKF